MVLAMDIKILSYLFYMLYFFSSCIVFVSVDQQSLFSAVCSQRYDDKYPFLKFRVEKAYEEVGFDIASLRSINSLELCSSGKMKSSIACNPSLLLTPAALLNFIEMAEGSKKKVKKEIKMIEELQKKEPERCRDIAINILCYELIQLSKLLDSKKNNALCSINDLKESDLDHYSNNILINLNQMIIQTCAKKNTFCCGIKNILSVFYN